MTNNFLDEHALVAISTFNSYFSIENMEKLFYWAHQNYSYFNIFFMDGASKFNLMAIGYDEQKAIRKTRSHDNNLKNKIIKSLSSIDPSFEYSQNRIILLSDLSCNKIYIDLYNIVQKKFDEDINFQRDCFEATKMMLSTKTPEVTQEALDLAVQYLLAELPLWFNTPDILDVNSSSLVYKDFSVPWQRICYDHKFLSPNQKITIKSVSV